ncbi:hypothetical protein ACFL2X_07435 [Candidatus Latescibacterota bacterium]
MKKIFILLTTIIIVIISLSCSKDHSAPTFGKYVQPKPSNIAAVYDSETETADVTWDMNDLTDVVGYQLSVSDSSVFDLGYVYPVPTGQVTNYSLNVKDKVGKTLYIKVAAIFNNETMNNYYGPRSDDTAVVIIESESE